MTKLLSTILLIFQVVHLNANPFSFEPDSNFFDTMEIASCTQLNYSIIYSDEFIEDQMKCIQNEVPLDFNSNTKAFINYFVVKKRSYCETMLQRKELYFPIFEKHLAEFELPQELKYLPIIESGLNPKAQSFAGAVGIWQFISSTAKNNGLLINEVIDERMDPEKSTVAACRFLKTLYSQFGDWRYAIAAYNCGPGNVRKAIKKSGYSKDFWTVYKHLPTETRGYVPQFMAVVYAMEYSEQFQFQPEIINYPFQYEFVTINSHCNIDTLCKELNLCNGELFDLNPELRMNTIYDSMDYQLKIPIQVLDDFHDRSTVILAKSMVFGEQNLTFKPKKITKPEKRYLKYNVKSGDYLGKIAQKYNVSVYDIKRWNKLTSNNIRVGQQLTIYSTYTAENSNVQVKKVSSSNKLYVVQPGDSLWSIANRFQGVTVDSLKNLNQLKNNNLKVGQQLILQ